MLERHQELFKEELGMVKGTEVKIHVEPDDARFYWDRPVPCAIRGKLDAG